jgi:hypothetical protein
MDALFFSSTTLDQPDLFISFCHPIPEDV